MSEDEIVSELMAHLSLHQAVAAEITKQFGDECAATHAHLASGYSKKLEELGVDPRLLEPLTVIQ